MVVLVVLLWVGGETEEEMRRRERNVRLLDGQEVGKSCVVVTINGKRIMFDCGMHMGYDDHRRYPDFSLISESGHFDAALTCIYPTKALAPLMLEDYRKVMVDRRGEEEQFSSENVLECLKKVTAVDLKQTVQVDKDLQIRAYYAGHVLGAAMFYAKVGESAIVYTGDYNMTPDRHLGAAQIDRLQLDLLITESTYATTVRDSKYAREREFLKSVHKCVANGGKVLIPTFALGRAQELCILLDDYWERMNLKVPIYFSAGLTIQANMYYKMLINWTSQKVKDTHATRNAFDFKHGGGARVRPDVMALGRGDRGVLGKHNPETMLEYARASWRLGKATGFVPRERNVETALGRGRALLAWVQQLTLCLGNVTRRQLLGTVGSHRSQAGDRHHARDT
ncbi:hypothetical protein RJ639_042092 [Escallonia herrerae]|uniref:Beta-Casp domain-containing protein n=1 Tax=Escallonia herrerae TaxID=1293975 RepID=A0AA88WLQ1_9ASTE|nr:hypothetical protein RJ639_042092 [Escallonia herrerae]